MTKRGLILLGLLLLSFGAVAGISIRLDQTLERSVLKDETAPNGMGYRLYVPEAATLFQALPLFVAFHGGTMDAAGMVELTRLNDLAEEIGFYVVYPEQDREANALGYWNWYSADNQTLGDNEPARVIELLDSLPASYRVDPKRVYALGFSAGGAMALSMQILYPDVFSGVAIASGLPFGAAVNQWEAAAAMDGFLAADEMLAARAIEAMPISKGKPIRAILVHGLEDDRVDPIASEALLKQLLAVNDRLDDGEVNGSFPLQPILDDSDVAKDPAVSRHVQYRNGQGSIVLSFLMLHAMAHKYPCPESASPFAWTESLDFSFLAVDFLLFEDR